jgi:hypothetical protein
MEKGVKELYIADGDADFPVDGTGVEGFGFHGTGKITFGNFGQITMENGMVLTSLKDFQIEKKTSQLGYSFMKLLFAAAKKSKLTAKAVCGDVVKGSGTTGFTAGGGIYTFENTNNLGLKFKFTLSPKDRSLTATLGRAFKPDTADDIEDAAVTDILPHQLAVPMLEAANLIKSYVTPPTTITDDRLSDWLLDLEITATANGMNKWIADKVTVKFTASQDQCTPAEIKSLRAGTSIAPDLTFIIPTDTPWSLVLKTGGLSQTGEAVIDEKGNIATVHYDGSYDIGFVDASVNNVITLKAQLT